MTSVPSPGLRERKKQRTRQAIQREALRLIREQGYDETTIEQIAAAADVSPSTFFNYFPTKEDVVLTDEYDPVVARAFLARPAGESLVESFRAVVAEIAELMDRDRDLILMRLQLMTEVPELRARIWDSLIEAQQLLVHLMAQRSNQDPKGLELRVGAIMLVAAMYEAGVEWAGGGGRESFAAVCERAIALAQRGLQQ